MSELRLAAAALNQTPMDWQGNCENISLAISRARELQATFLLCPELSICGYGCEDAFLSHDVERQSVQVLESLIPQTAGLVALVGLPLRHKGDLYNCMAVVADQRLLGFTAKQNLCGDGIHYEPRWFNPWPAGEESEIEVLGSKVSFGDICFEHAGTRFGFEICEDAWVSKRPFRSLVERGAQIIFNPNASHFAFAKDEVRAELALSATREADIVFVSANLLGCEAGRIIYDGGCLVAHKGEVLARNQRFSFQPFDLCVADLSPADSSTVQYLKHDKCEEFSRTVALGLFDYLRKSKAQGFVVSLSGGADSSATASLVYLMVRLAIAELGFKQFCERLASIQGLLTCSESDVVSRLLTCIYQKTKNNSDETFQAAQKLSDALGAQFYLYEIDEIIDSYLELIAKETGHTPNWRDDDIAMQNIQARARVPALWFVANTKNALLLTTSNRSEAAVGYATMDGDTSGSLNPIGGIDKAFLRDWLRWLEEEGPRETGGIQALKYVNCQQPSAELRPLSSKQSDENDLMPYEVLDRIEKCAIRDKLSPLETYLVIEKHYQRSFLASELGEWVNKFFRLWCRNQWKRERYAPSFHLDDENLDPKTWCRFPILSGNYDKELAELNKYLQENVLKD